MVVIFELIGPGSAILGNRSQALCMLAVSLIIAGLPTYKYFSHLRLQKNVEFVAELRCNLTHLRLEN